MLEQLNLANIDNLKQLLENTGNELRLIQPRIEELEELLAELKELKQAKQRLITLKMSLQTLVETNTLNNAPSNVFNIVRFSTPQVTQNKTLFSELSASKIFHPDVALREVEQLLKQKQSVNFDLFRAVVFNGGHATTEEMKTYLIEAGIKQPQSGEGFENVALTEISSRANYLVRKGVLHVAERGAFYTHLGWCDPE